MKAAVRKRVGRQSRGFALVTSMIFLLVFSVLAVSVASRSNTNLQIADTHRKANKALCAAQSGLEVMRYFLGNITLERTTPSDQVISEVCNELQNDSNLPLETDGNTIDVQMISLESQQSSFEAQITRADYDTLRVWVTGYCDDITRRVRIDFDFGDCFNPIFDYGLASRGALSMSGNVHLHGVTSASEADVYLKADGWSNALTVKGNSHIAGNVKISDSYAGVTLKGNSSIGGETGQDAIDNHVEFGVEPPEFPEPNPDEFEPYAVNIVDSTTKTYLNATYENVRVIAGTNPTFTANFTLNGVMFIETPNIVTFQGNTTINGIIVGDGDATDDSGTNKLKFRGNVESHSVSELPAEPQFAELKEKTGTFVLAPGFDVSFRGNFSTLNGAIAGNGISFSGNSGGTVKGSLINYADTQVTFSGNSELYFDHLETDDVPAGFETDVALQYDPNSYSELIN